jgi:pimeloyl-ACP methyl ester carboxylesterase
VRAEFRDVLGRRMRCLRAGRGPALLMIHGVGYPADVFVRNLDALGEGRETIAPDLPGQGFSEGPARWDVPPQVGMADAVIALADQLGLERFAVLGSSLGGLVAALVALRARDRVDALVLVGTGSTFNDPAGQPATLARVFENGSSAYRDPSIATCRARLANTCFRAPPAEDLLLAQITAYALPGALESYRAIIDGVAASIGDPAASALPHLERITARTLVVIGENDPRTSRATHEAGVARIPHARLVAYPECGHLPFLELPGRFNADVAAFLDASAPCASGGRA